MQFSFSLQNDFKFDSHIQLDKIAFEHTSAQSPGLDDISTHPLGIWQV